MLPFLVKVKFDIVIGFILQKTKFPWHFEGHNKINLLLKHIIFNKSRFVDRNNWTIKLIKIIKSMTHDI